MVKFVHEKQYTYYLRCRTNERGYISQEFYIFLLARHKYFVFLVLVEKFLYSGDNSQENGEDFKCHFENYKVAVPRVIVNIFSQMSYIFQMVQKFLI